MSAQRLPDGKIRIPVRLTSVDAEGKEMLGDGVQDIGPEDPSYAKWDAYLKRMEEIGDGW